MSNAAANSLFAARPSTADPAARILLAATPIRKPTCEGAQNGETNFFSFPFSRSPKCGPYAPENTEHKDLKKHGGASWTTRTNLSGRDFSDGDLFP
jgi:hypothetical protein